MRDFWISSGHHFLDRDEAGRLLVTDPFIKTYLARPELTPPDEACEAERRIHNDLLTRDPRRPVGAEEIAAIIDGDARENWRLMLDLRDRLMAAPSIEAAYLELARGAGGATPPLFMNHLVHVLLRNALEGESDPFVLRAAETFYRPQRLAFHEGTALLADAETIERHERERRRFPLLGMLGGPAAAALDVLEAGNADDYFARSDAFDMALDLCRARRGLATAMGVWVYHLLGVQVEVEPVERMEDENWAWIVGLDAEASRLGNALWRGGALDAEAEGRIVALFRLGFRDPRVVRPEVGARPVWLILAMTPDRTIRLKPQNLLANLPLCEF